MSIHTDVAAAIGQQVEQMIMQAKKDSEARVKHDLQVARTQLQQMEANINKLDQRVAACAQRPHLHDPQQSQTVDRAYLSSKITHLEQKWASEVKALKQDLHRTILAHNHNSDLMRHHRDALDEVRKRLDAQQQPRAEQVDSQISKVDRMLLNHANKTRTLDGLQTQLTDLEGSVNTLANPAAGLSFPPMLGGLAGLHGNQMLAQALAEQQRDAAAAGSAAGAAPPKQRGAKKDAEAARLAATNFNAEAPCFVPGGSGGGVSPASGEEAAGKGDEDVDDADGVDGGENGDDGADEADEDSDDADVASPGAEGSGDGEAAEAS